MKSELGRRHSRVSAVAVAVILALSFSSCSSAEEKKYDISPIFPLSPNKCEKYNGEVEGTGISAHCWVTLTDCKRAAADWAASMKKSGVNEAILFRCE